jgi:hypothetical protein
MVSSKFIESIGEHIPTAAAFTPTAAKAKTLQMKVSEFIVIKITASLDMRSL